VRFSGKGSGDRAAHGRRDYHQETYWLTQAEHLLLPSLEYVRVFELAGFELVQTDKEYVELVLSHPLWLGLF
jgi:hypothetical protein